jgi:predicted amidophosphoribosyltransferase
VLPSVTRFKRVALDFLFPPWCIGCGREGSYICDSCRPRLPAINPPVCPRCGRPRAQGAPCPGCIAEDSAIDGIRAPFLFNGVIRRAVHELKYRNLRAVVPLLASFLNDFLRENPLPGDQASLLCRELSRLNRLPVINGCLIKNTYTPSQARTFDVVSRQANVTGAFTCVDERLRGKYVILVDDVSTSGATLNACAVALKSAGALEVWGLVLALEL